jgi:hypothetical protein
MAGTFAGLLAGYAKDETKAPARAGFADLGPLDVFYRERLSPDRSLLSIGHHQLALLDPQVL